MAKYDAILMFYHLQEARSFASGLSLQLIIWKWPNPPDDHLQEARSFASGLSLQLIICKWPDPPDDHLQEAGCCGWSFARGWILWMIICKGPDPPLIICKRPYPLDDNLKKAGSSRWSFAKGRILRIVIVWVVPLRSPIADVHLELQQHKVKAWRCHNVHRTCVTLAAN